MNTIWKCGIGSIFYLGQSESGQIQRQIYTNHQSETHKVVLKFLKNSSEQTNDYWPVAFLRSLVISDPVNMDEIGENRTAYMI